MAKKRRKRNRRPVAPPVHSAPDAAMHGPTGPGAVEPPPARPFTPDPPPTGAEPVARTEVPRRPAAGARRTPPRRRRSRRRNYFIAGAVVGAIVLLALIPVYLGRRSMNQFNKLAAAAGCSSITETSGSGAAEHLAEGEKTTYETTPPTHGKHATTTLGAGVYERRLSDNPEEDLNIYKAVHSLEHGAVIVWYDGLSDEDKRRLESTYRTGPKAEKVLVVPYPLLKGKTKVAMTAWGRMVTCDKLSTDVIDGFIERFREARSAPEPRNGI